MKVANKSKCMHRDAHDSLRSTHTPWLLKVQNVNWATSQRRGQTRTRTHYLQLLRVLDSQDFIRADSKKRLSLGDARQRYLPARSVKRINYESLQTFAKVV